MNQCLKRNYLRTTVERKKTMFIIYTFVILDNMCSIYILVVQVKRIDLEQTSMDFSVQQ